MNLVTPMPCMELAASAPPDSAMGPVRPGEIELLLCIRSLGGWVGAQGLAPREILDGLAARGLLEVWPGRPLYRVPAGIAS